VKRLLQGGVDVLADPTDLQAMCYAARPFRPVFDRKILPKDAKDAEIAFDATAGVVNVVWEQLRLSLSLPAGYAELAKDPKKLSATAPYPVIVTLHELEDFQDAKGAKKFPGFEAIRRRWDRRAPATKAVADACFVLAPVATRARFVEDGRVQPSRVLDPLRETWQRYHVDVDRVVLDGGSDALLAATCMSNFLAGVIVRGDAADLPSPALLRNLATVRVFVVGTEASAFAKAAAAAAEAGEFPKDRVTVGTADGIAAWLQKLPRREVPKSFRWTVADKDTQAFAHWAILQPDPAVSTAEFAAEVVDTAQDPNTIRLTAKGIVSATILLSDQFVSLDREIRVVANGVVVKEARVLDRPGGRPVALPTKFERTVDGMFDNPELSIRKSLYYGLWSPVMLVVEVPR
jgi:hypothetical protein